MEKKLTTDLTMWFGLLKNEKRKKENQLEIKLKAFLQSVGQPIKMKDAINNLVMAGIHAAAYDEMIGIYNELYRGVGSIAKTPRSPEFQRYIDIVKCINDNESDAKIKVCLSNVIKSASKNVDRSILPRNITLLFGIEKPTFREKFEFLCLVHDPKKCNGQSLREILRDCREYDDFFEPPPQYTPSPIPPQPQYPPSPIPPQTQYPPSPPPQTQYPPSPPPQTQYPPSPSPQPQYPPSPPPQTQYPPSPPPQTQYPPSPYPQNQYPPNPPDIYRKTFYEIPQTPNAQYPYLFPPCLDQTSSSSPCLNIIIQTNNPVTPQFTYPQMNDE